jgi:hypothetical protein
MKLRQSFMATNDPPKFFNKGGWLSPYALGCGYVERVSARNIKEIEVELYKEHGTYHVRVHDRRNDASVNRARQVWLSFRTLTEARKQFKAFVRTY